MIRVAAIKEQILAEILEYTPDGQVPLQKLRAIHERVARMVEDMRSLFRDDLHPKLAANGIHLLRFHELREAEQSTLASLFEREIFPAVIEAGHPVVGFLARSYWMDLGTPEKYLQAHFDLLEGKVRGVEYPAPWIAPNADVDLRARLGRRVAVGAEARIGPEAEVEDAVVHPGAWVGDGARVRDTIVVNKAGRRVPLEKGLPLVSVETP